MKYEIKFTGRFKKDLKVVQKQGKDLNKLFSVIESLANDVTLNPKHRDHGLSGEFIGFRECHIEPDWLLIYCLEKDELILYLMRTGSHSDLLF